MPDDKAFMSFALEEAHAALEHDDVPIGCAVVLARVERLVYGAPDPKAGAVRSLYNVADDALLNHRVAVTEGVLEEESGELLRTYFSAKRG